MKNNSFDIAPLKKQHIKKLVSLIKQAGSSYSIHFTPFKLTQAGFLSVLSSAKKDMYWGIFINKKPVGFYILRGLDEGFSIPSYGVWISPDFSGNGLATLTLYHAMSVCRISGITTIMLKVYPDNKIAENIYKRAGFVKKGIDPKNNNFIYYKNLN